ncbi:MAG: DUF3106 domain-containing protein [Planctomycetes bacterium]|nr:DUF3106 domain-containing protein [Planctomycetota bacterium]
MYIDYLKEKKEFISVALLCVSVVLAVSIFVKVIGFFTASARAEKIVNAAISQNTEEASDIDKYFTKYKVLADALKKNNLFAPPPPKQHPVKEVTGIFGDEVIIRDKLYKVGDKVADATIVSIGSTQVTIEWDGKKKTFSPMDAGGSSQPGGSRNSRASARGKSARESGGTAQMVTIGSDGFRDKGGKSQSKSNAKMQAKREKLDKENLKAIEKRWSTLPESVRQKLTEIKERWPSMSEGERDKIRKGLNERYGGGKRGGK